MLYDLHYACSRYSLRQETRDGLEYYSSPLT